MKHIQQLQSILLNKEEYKDLVDWTEIKNIWALLVNTLESQVPTKLEDGSTNYNMSIKCEFVGKVIQHNDGQFDCNIDSSFQDDYTEDELKELIIQDIEDEYKNKIYLDNLCEFTNAFKKWMNYIKEYDNNLTDL